jgi:hypothetical protein
VLERRQRDEATAQELAKRRRLLATLGIEIGTAKSAAGGKGAHALAAARTDVGSAGSHLDNQRASMCVDDQGLLSGD